MKVNGATRSGFAAVIGVPNAGKSTLINSLMGEQLVITSAKRQTTRQQFRCILTGEDYQIVFVDTPGLHQPRSKLGEYMAREIQQAIANSDLVLYIQDATNPRFEPLPDAAKRKPILLVLNKIDLLNPKRIADLKDKFRQEDVYAKVVAVSAQTGANLSQLISETVAHLPLSEYLYPPDQLMDCDYRLLVSELIREQALTHLAEEVPHGIAIEITSFVEDEAEATISANIIVERDSHKGIVIGRGGSMLKTIGTGARQEIQNLMGLTVHLKLWVKVNKNWRKNSNQLRWLGYK